MGKKSIREQLDDAVLERYGIVPEQLPFNHEDYAVYRHPDTGKWFAVMIVKPRSAFGLEGDDEAEVMSVKIADPLLAELLYAQPGYLRGYPSSRWNWVSVVLDGTVPFEEVCRWLDASYAATRSKGKNQNIPLPKRT